MIVADAKQAAEVEHCVGYLAADLVDHDTLDVTNFCPSGPYSFVPSTLSLPMRLKVSRSSMAISTSLMLISSEVTKATSHPFRQERPQVAWSGLSPAFSRPSTRS